MAPPLGSALAGSGRLRLTARTSHRCVLLASRLATVTRTAQALTIRNAVPFATLRDRHDVISVCLAWITAHATTRTALPCVTRKHRLPPRPVLLVAVAPCSRIGAGTVITPA